MRVTSLLAFVLLALIIGAGVYELAASGYADTEFVEESR